MGVKKLKISSKEPKVLHRCVESYKDGYPTLVCSGGSNSGKTYSILKYLSIHWSYRNDLVITVIGQDLPNLRVGAIRDWESIISNSPYLQQTLLKRNKSQNKYTSQTGSVIEFKSFDGFQDAKSGKRDFSFFNEANGISYSVYEQIEMRTSEQVLLDFNPSHRFYAHEKLKPQPEVDWCDSTFRDNPFVDDEIRKKILGFEPTKENIDRGTASEYKWQVYGLGKVGRLEGLVFPDFETTNDWPENYKWRVYGLDFGYTNDPTALVEIRYAKGSLYWKQYIYSTGMTNPDIANEMKRLGFDKTMMVVADSAEPKSIEELKRKGLHIVPAEKGPDSVSQGIDAIKRYPLYIDAGSNDLVEEFSSYQWKEDKDGKSTNKPIDDYNHGIDGGRYALAKKILNDRRPLQADTITF